MQIRSIFILLIALVLTLEGNSYQDQNQGKNKNFSIKVLPKQSETRSSKVSSPLNVRVLNKNQEAQKKQMSSYKPKVSVVPPSVVNQTQQKAKQNLDVIVYPPTIKNDAQDIQNRINAQVEASKPITQEMMFQKKIPYKMKLPPRKKKVKQVVIQSHVPVVQDEYEGEDIEPLFIRNRNGVMIGAGIGGSFDRLWVGGSDGNTKFYDSALTYYFRLGYQYYLVKYLGFRVYAHLGDWSNQFSNTFFDGKRDVAVEAKLNFNYSFFAEVLYDFVVLENHSFGVFAGFGIGVSYGEFSNDGTDKIVEYFAMPAISVGFAYTLYENNRFEFESKVPLRSEILKKTWRSELSTWMLGVSYTYIF